MRLVRVNLAERQWTQEFLAGRVGISPEYLSAVLRGKRPVAARLVMKISRAFELSPDDERRLLSAAGYGTSTETDDQAGRAAGRRRGPTHGAPVSITLGDRDELLRDILRRLDALEAEAKAIRDIVALLLQSDGNR